MPTLLQGASAEEAAARHLPPSLIVRMCFEQVRESIDLLSRRFCLTLICGEP
jgi:hypothetical protein